MSFLSWLLPSSKSKEYKPLYGQRYFDATGFDSQHEELYCSLRDKLNVKINNIEKNIKFAVGVIENSCDTVGIATALRITNVEFLKLIACEKSYINDILKFIYKYGDKLSLLCNFCVVTQEATPIYKSTRAGIQAVSNLLLGHHIIICIPLEERITINDEVIEHIKSLLSRTTYAGLPEYLMQEAAILIDYNVVLHKPAFEMLNELSDTNFSKKVSSLYAELNVQPKSKDYNYFDNRTALWVLIKLKKLIYLLEDKFLFNSNYKCGKRHLAWNERTPIAEEISLNIHKILNMDVSTSSGPALRTLYDLCKVYELEYCYAVYENVTLPNMHQSLDHKLEKAIKTINALSTEIKNESPAEEFKETSSIGEQKENYMSTSLIHDITQSFVIPKNMTQNDENIAAVGTLKKKLTC